MKRITLYKKWNYLILLNSMVMVGFFVVTKKNLWLRFDISNFFFWVYTKKIKVRNKKIWGLKKRFDWV